MYFIFLHTKDVQGLMNVSNKAALEYIDDIIQEFGIDVSKRPRSQKITIREYCDYFGCEYVDVLNALLGKVEDSRGKLTNKQRKEMEQAIDADDSQERDSDLAVRRADIFEGVKKRVSSEN